MNRRARNHESVRVFKVFEWQPAGMVDALTAARLLDIFSLVAVTEKRVTVFWIVFELALTLALTNRAAYIHSQKILVFAWD